ncbi:MAG: hypothetical protein MNSN_06820 [Minisyncoccus archaeiphilus]|nr:MAG: hypothetical protein MNSN_06820 [Candidatus Parcubacteria bacterium]
MEREDKLHVCNCDGLCGDSCKCKQKQESEENNSSPVDDFLLS